MGPHRMVLVACLLLTLAVSRATAQTPAPTPGPEVQRMGYWVGSWSAVGEYKTATANPKYEGVVDCEWFTGGFVVLCTLTLAGDNDPTVNIWSYSQRDKAYNWYWYDGTGASRAVWHIVLTGNTWVCDREGTYQGKPAKYRYEWTEETPTSATYRMSRSVESGPMTLVYDVKLTKKAKS